MRSHHLSRVLLAVSAVFFVVALETFAQGYGSINEIGSATGTTSAPAAFPLFTSGPDLLRAGFTNPQKIEPKASGFLEPVAYYRVDETVASSGWGSAANIVAISIRPIQDANWLYNNGQMAVLDLNGRTQVRISRPGYYIVVTGPTANKVVALANILKEK